jgi:hypothetical protein
VAGTPPLVAGFIALLAAVAAVAAFVRFAPVPQREPGRAPPPAVQPDVHREVGLRPR